jgi:hypothetical protein
MVLMDSRGSKDSNDTKFTKFGQVDYFLSILQVTVENWNLNLNFKTKS